MLSGDLHHYARYTGLTRDLVTSGGGGAYLYPTHRLPETLQVPPPTTLVRKSTPSQPYRRAATFPTQERSRQLAAGVFDRLPWRNPGFAVLVGFVQTLLMLAYAGAALSPTGAAARLFSIPVL